MSVEQVEQEHFKDLIIMINGIKYKIKKVNLNFANFIESSLEEENVKTNQDNRADSLLSAYIKLAQKYYKCEIALEEMIEKIDI